MDVAWRLLKAVQEWSNVRSLDSMICPLRGFVARLWMVQARGIAGESESKPPGAAVFAQRRGEAGSSRELPYLVANCNDTSSCMRPDPGPFTDGAIRYFPRELQRR